MAGEFEGKVVVVTGGSRGIGRAIAAAFAREGAQTVLAAANAANLADGAKAVAAAGGPAPLTVAGDLRTLAACEALFDAVNDKFKRCDVLVNNAGATKGGKFFELPDEAWSDGFALKFHAAVRLTRLFWPLLKASHGNIVNIIGGAARTPGPEFLIGGAVNAAMANFAKGLTALGNRDDININVIHPGQIETDRVVQLFAAIRQGAEQDAGAGARRVAGEERTAPHRPAGGRRRAGRCSWPAPRAATSRAPRSPSMAAPRRGFISSVIPLVAAKAGIQGAKGGASVAPDSRLRGNDGMDQAHLLHNIDRPPQQRHRGLQRAEGGVRGQRDVLHACASG